MREMGDRGSESPLTVDTSRWGDRGESISPPESTPLSLSLPLSTRLAVYTGGEGEGERGRRWKPTVDTRSARSTNPPGRIL